MGMVETTDCTDGVAVPLGRSPVAGLVEWGIRRERIARQVARKCVERGLWTEEEGEVFLEAVGVEDTAGLRPAAGSSDPARASGGSSARAAKGDFAKTVANG